MVDQISAIDNIPLDDTLASRPREAALCLAIEQFYFGYRAFTVQPDRILAERGLGRVHHRILYFVGRNPRMSVNALLSMLGVSKQALNAPLRQLVEMQLVAIDTAEHDKRVRELSLTSSGAELETQLTGTQMQQLQTVFEQVGSDAEAGWHQVMRSLSSQG
ncbi:MarR family transcriptional regulator [Methylomonas montana]|uniref:MarR family winged helix-turn-helix transcriptional regulator n=1 Tax=Methylomonas montana TaxID=3058963 RepID=UPI00265B5D26|nr:MarR family transcriptional regulator [Methylomonas montana]WKJ90623.1 MarR family transcriptional regulator [Methylomonas montana]